ncbi:MAG: pyridoxamine 5'-phosphate oxidase family protein [Phenylobacterium sp.]|uniref:pyridoxamine 5'-phosphate oxidase family protein n=2 Tax=Phenylobacterium sp. TaxID=1871053 RepID=UPI0017F1B8A5|nr:pyridoxamine 5'-phosphate oxidase family protein [Phenylobacterium sp.]MBA4792996.1 pyridoxamine 5'-phosphate oxidase family protein [Phenylobacterium sp.]
MSAIANDTAAVERRLWNEIENHQIGMLGVVGGAPHHLQPMTAFAEPDASRLWFFTRDDTDLVREIGDGHSAMFVFQQRDFRACVAGRLTVRHDRARMDKYWNAVVAAWYPDGKDDPHLTLLCMECADAQVWVSEAGPIRFAWEIAKANATGHQPDLGGRTEVRFH